MDRSIVSSLPTEKLDRTNYASWSHKMHQYLLGHGYRSYVDGVNDPAPESTQGLFGLGTSDKQGNVLLRIQCHRSAAQPYPKREDVEGGLGKSEKDFLREYHGSEIATQARAQQYPTKGHVGVVKIRHYVRIVRRNHRGSGPEGSKAQTCKTSKI